MSEKTFVRFVEDNENEGEAWTWWLQLTGNEDELGKFAELLRAELECDDDCEFDYHEDGPYELFPQDVEPEVIVDKLVEYAEDGYFAAHNKVVGVFVCPETLGEDGLDLYKGGVREYFAAAS